MVESNEVKRADIGDGPRGTILEQVRAADARRARTVFRFEVEDTIKGTPKLTVHVTAVSETEYTKEVVPTIEFGAWVWR